MMGKFSKMRGKFLEARGKIFDVRGEIFGGGKLEEITGVKF